MEIRWILNQKEIKDKVPYKSIINNWCKINGSFVNKKYKKSFSLKERKVISAYVTIFRRWFKKGFPENCSFDSKNIPLLKRVNDFLNSN